MITCVQLYSVELIFNAFIKTFLAEFHVKIYGLLYEDIESNKDTHDYRVFLIRWNAKKTMLKNKLYRNYIAIFMYYLCSRSAICFCKSCTFCTSAVDTVFNSLLMHKKYKTTFNVYLAISEHVHIM